MGVPCGARGPGSPGDRVGLGLRAAVLAEGHLVTVLAEGHVVTVLAEGHLVTVLGGGHVVTALAVSELQERASRYAEATSASIAMRLSVARSPRS